MNDSRFDFDPAALGGTIALVILGILALAFMVKLDSDCNERGGVMVKGLLTYECVKVAPLEK